MEILERLKLMPDTFAGRVAVVTGAARGIGEHVAICLAHLGAHVIVLDMRAEVEETAERIRGNARLATFAKVDLRDMEALDRFQRETLVAHGAVDILVNNASKLEFEYFQSTQAEQWDDLHHTTVRASSYLSKKFLPGMLANGYGVICNTLGPEAMTYGAHFAAAVAGQKSMVVSLAGELGNDSDVSVFGFVPGVVDTPLVRELAPSVQRFFGITQEERIDKTITVPGYGGSGYERLMPAEHCGASYAYCIAHAKVYQGQAADAFHPLINHGIVTPIEGDEELRLPYEANAADLQIQDYVQGVSAQSRNLETRIAERTKELEAANQQLAKQKRLLEDVSSKISRYLPTQVYQSIFDGEIDAEIRSRRKHLTVFFSDIRDFTRGTERLEPEALSGILNTYFSAMTEIARAHGATIDKFVGDAILAFFGDPESLGTEEDARRSIDMAIEMQRRMNDLQPNFLRLGLQEPLEIRIGINSGYCTVGNFGSFERLDYTIIGTPVNIASRLQEHAAPGTILVAKSTEALVADRFRFAPHGRLELKGIADEVEAFEVLFGDDAEIDLSGPAGNQITAIREQLAEIDIEQLGDAEREDLLAAMSKLIKR